MRRLAADLDQNEDLRLREADLAVRMVRPTQVGLVARKLSDVPISLFAHQGCIAVYGNPTTAQPLAGHVLIGADRHSLSLTALADAGIAHRMARFCCDHQGRQINAIRARMSIGAMQVGIARVSSELFLMLPGSLSFDFEYWLVMHQDLRHT